MYGVTFGLHLLFKEEKPPKVYGSGDMVIDESDVFYDTAENHQHRKVTYDSTCVGQKDPISYEELTLDLFPVRAHKTCYDPKSLESWWKTRE